MYNVGSIYVDKYDMAHGKIDKASTIPPIYSNIPCPLKCYDSTKSFVNNIFLLIYSPLSHTP